MECAINIVYTQRKSVSRRYRGTRIGKLLPTDWLCEQLISKMFIANSAEYILMGPGMLIMAGMGWWCWGRADKHSLFVVGLRKLVSCLQWVKSAKVNCSARRWRRWWWWWWWCTTTGSTPFCNHISQSGSRATYAVPLPPPPLTGSCMTVVVVGATAAAVAGSRKWEAAEAGNWQLATGNQQHWPAWPQH